MRNDQIILVFFLMLMTAIQVTAQKNESLVMNLDECLEYAYEHNENITIADLEKDRQNAYVGEIMAQGLPQLNGNADFKKNLKLRTTLFDVSNINPEAPPGTYVEAQFGVDYEGDLGLSATQLIFNGSYFVGLKAAKVFKELSSKDYIKTKIDVAEAVSKAYYSVLVSEEGLELVKSNYDRLDSLLRETKIMQENGFVERIDLNRAQVQFNNISAQLGNQKRVVEYSKQLLKFQMGMPLETGLEIEDKPSDLIINYSENLADTVNPHNRIEYEQLSVNQTLAELDLKNNTVQYFPNIDLYFDLGMSAGAPTSSELFTIGGDFWFDYQAVGVRASLPIFDGFMKSKKIQQNRIKLRQIDQQFNQLEKQIHLEVENARKNLLNNLNNLKNQQENMQLAEEVYDVSRIKYKEGVGSSTELIDADNAYKEAQSNYYNALLETLLSKVDYEKALGILLEN